ncbi:MAG: FUSC family protein [Candidatus Nanopelagicales bacterium]
MSYVGSVARSVLATDWSKRRGWSAFRRGVVVVASMLVFGGLYGPDIGALASVAALYVGLQDRAADPPSFTVRIMFVQSLVLGGVVFLAGVSSRSFVPAVLLVACAAMSGLTARHDKAVSRMFADVIAVEAFLGLSRITNEYALHAFIAVLAASLTQTLFTRLSARFQSDLPERRPVAAALLAVATHIDDAQTRNVRGTGQAATAALNAADASVSRSDLSHKRRRALRKLLGDAEALREEASSMRARRAFDTAVIVDQNVDDAARVASETLRATARALTAIQTPGVPVDRVSSALLQVDTCAAEAAQIAERPDLRGTAIAMANQSQRLATHLNNLLRAPDGREGDRGRHMRSALGNEPFHPRPIDIKTGARLALAAVLGMWLAHVLHLGHGGWVAATTVALMRPDHRALTSDTIARALGTAIGAAAVIPLVALTTHTPVSNLIMVWFLATLTFAITSANEGLYIIVITIETVFTRAVVGEDPVSVAIDRVQDVTLGCAIAIVLLIALPLRHGRRLRSEMADYANATADWLDAVAKLCKSGKEKRHKALHRQMTSARANVQHGLDLRQVEPLGPGMPPWLGQNLFTLIHDAERASVAAEVSLRHGAKGSKGARKAATRAAQDLREAAIALKTHASDEDLARWEAERSASAAELMAAAELDAASDSTPVSQQAPGADAPTGTQTDIERLLRLAAREARGAKILARTRHRDPEAAATRHNDPTAATTADHAAAAAQGAAPAPSREKDVDKDRND